jgi:hypothetical protein
MKLVKYAIVVAAFIVLNGCSSQKDFVRPSLSQFTLGKSTLGQVIDVEGAPTVPAQDVELNGEKVKYVTYFYHENPKFWGMIIDKHSLSYAALNDVIVSEEYNSTYDKDKTEFDVSKIPQVKKGMTEAEVIAIMGTATGRAIYPIVKNKQDHGLIYGYNYERFAGMLTSNNDLRLIVSLNPENSVTDVAYRKDGKDQEIK